MNLCQAADQLQGAITALTGIIIKAGALNTPQEFFNTLRETCKMPRLLQFASV